MLTTKRALVFALLAYIFTFIAALVSSISLGYDPSQLMGTPPTDYCIAIIISSGIAAVIFTYLYFTHKKPQLKPGAKDGFRFGVTMIILSFVLDMIFFLPLVINTGNFKQAAANYGSWYVYVVLLVVLAGSAGVGYWLEKKPKS